MGRNISIPYSCAKMSCMALKSASFSQLNYFGILLPSSEINTPHGKELGERPRQEALYDQ